MSLKASWLMLIFVTGGYCYRFGGSVGASSHAVAGGSAKAEFSQDGKNGDLAVTKSRKTGFADWSGTAAAGGYFGQAQPNYNPNANISGIGGGAAASAHLGRSVGGETVAKVHDGKIDTNILAVSAAEKSFKTVGEGFVGSELQGEADRISSFGRQAGNMPPNGNPYGGAYGTTYGNLYGPRYSPPQGDSRYGNPGN